MKILIFYKKYLFEYKGTLTVYVALIFVSTAISILSPYILGEFVDRLIEGGDINIVLRFSILFGSLNLIKIIKNYITAIMQVKMQTRMAYNLNMDVIQHIQKLSLSFTEKQDSAYLSQRIRRDSFGLINFCVSTLQSVLVNTVVLIVPLIILLFMHYFIALIMTGFLLLYIVLYLAFRKPLYNVSLLFTESQAKFFSRLVEQLKHVKNIKMNSSYEKMAERTSDSFETYRHSAIKSQKVNYLYNGLDGIVSTIAQIILFVSGGIAVMTGNFTIGMFTIFTIYFKMMLGSSKFFFGLGASYQQVLVSHDRIKEILEQNVESNGNINIDKVNKIELHDLCFSYKKTDKQGNTDEHDVLFNVNECFEKGNIYAISGGNGKGKSSFISLLSGMYVNKYKGRISYDGVDIHDIDMISARKNLFGFTEQEPILISDSIRYNIEYNESNDVNRKILRTFIDILNMREFISKRTLNYEINENNTNISGGEKQKISILKVLLKSPSILIFDEPTSALDTATIENFVSYLCSIKKDKIIIIITHDENVKSCCDKIIRL